MTKYVSQKEKAPKHHSIKTMFQKQHDVDLAITMNQVTTEFLENGSGLMQQRSTYKGKDTSRPRGKKNSLWVSIIIKEKPRS
jgi:hypothetical protein